MRTPIFTSFAIAAILAASGQALAQYQVTIVNPAATNEAFVNGVGNGSQAGFASGPATGGNTHGFVWNGTAASAVDVNPLGTYPPNGNPFSGSFLYGAGGGQQVGFVIAGPLDVATVWAGTAASATFLATPEMINSVAYGTDGVHQVGSARIDDPFNGLVTHAFAWAGSPETAIDIHPDFAFESFANRVQGNVAAGTTASPDGFYNAVLWTSIDPPVAISLHPADLFESVATDVAGTQVVGYGYPDGSPNHALIWNTDLEGPSDVHPAGYQSSFLYATNGSQQVGLASTLPDGEGNNHEHAFVWSSTSASAVDLHELLVASFPGYTDSQARGIDAAGNIYGNANISGTGYIAVRWAPVGGNTCDPDLNQDGNADQGDIDYLVNVVAGGENPTGIDADFNQDGNVDQGDIDALINVVAGGDCP
ncbi:MAG: hypothetical protein WC718_09190 [Phycisphaerales bacterium]|jgi:hypothetical protein